MFSKGYGQKKISRPLARTGIYLHLPIQSRDPTFLKPSYIIFQTQGNGVLGKQNYKHYEIFTCKNDGRWL